VFFNLLCAHDQSKHRHSFQNHFIKFITTKERQRSKGADTEDAVELGALVVLEGAVAVAGAWVVLVGAVAVAVAVAGAWVVLVGGAIRV